MERHFLIKPGQPRGMALISFYPFSKFPYKSEVKSGNKRVCQNETAKYGRNIPTGIIGVPFGGGPEYSGRKELKQNLSFNLRPEFPESLAQRHNFVSEVARPHTGSWFLFGVLFIISDKQPRPFCMGVASAGLSFVLTQGFHAGMLTHFAPTSKLVRVLLQLSKARWTLVRDFWP